MEPRMDVLFRGRCGTWVLEDPDENTLLYRAVEAAQVYQDFYGVLDDPGGQPFDGHELCVHGERVDSGCVMCCEEFLVQQLALCKFLTDEDEEGTVQYILGLLNLPVSEDMVRGLVRSVYEKPAKYDPLGTGEL